MGESSEVINYCEDDLENFLKEFEDQVVVEKRLLCETLYPLSLSRHLGIGLSRVHGLLPVIKLQDVRNKRVTFMCNEWKQFIGQLKSPRCVLCNENNKDTNPWKLQKYNRSLILTFNGVSLRLSTIEIKETIRLEQLINMRIEQFEKLRFAQVYNNILSQLLHLPANGNRVNYILNTLALDDVCKQICMEMIIYTSDRLEEDIEATRRYRDSPCRIVVDA